MPMPRSNRPRRVEMEKRRQAAGSPGVLLLDEDLVSPREDWSELPLPEIPQWYGAARAAWLASRDSEEQ